MAFKISGAKQNELSNIVSELDEAHGELESAVERWNGAVKSAQEFRDEVVNEMQGQYDEKSEAWQEGERGQAAADFISSWENLDLEGITDSPDNISGDLADAPLEAE